NYYYFDAKPGIAYDLYTTSTLDTQGTLYDTDKNRLGYDDNSGLENNFAFIQSYDGRRYLKVGTKGTATGSYTLTLKKRFAIPEPVGEEGQDSYIIRWDAIDKAKEYLVTIYNASGKIGEAIVTGTSYEYVYTNETVGRTLAFTVTPRENTMLTGEPSRKIYNTNNSSEWSYKTPMNQTRKNFSRAVCDGKLYVLGGETEEGALKSLEVYDPSKETWTLLAAYPGDLTGLCHAAMVTVGKEIYVIGGQSDTSTKARITAGVYAYNTVTGTWSKKKDMAERRTKLSTALYQGKIYAFSQIGTTERVDVYDPAEDSWENHTFANTSTIVQAFNIDGRLFVLREESYAGKGMYLEEYLPDTGKYDNEGTVCPFANADRYTSGTVVNGKIYLNKENETDQVIYYDVYTDKWGQVSVLNLRKEKAQLQSIGEVLYSVGGTMTGFGTLDVLEALELNTVTVAKQLEVTEGEIYELQVKAGNCKEDTEYVVTIRVDADALAYRYVSSFMQKEAMEKKKDGIELIHYAPKRGVMVFRLRSTIERGKTKEAYQSIPVKGLADRTTTVRMQVEEA
ncbi:MAG: hypothetical protein J1F02_11340, partial [Lachnospiraceae bacterium]|nr:hypothetical protein [Lachnospiraceae bacterium]